MTIIAAHAAAPMTPPVVMLVSSIASVSNSNTATYAIAPNNQCSTAKLIVSITLFELERRCVMTDILIGGRKTVHYSA